MHRISPWVWSLAATCTVFVALKLTNLGVRLSDTNIYITMADRLWSGDILYRDMFLTNLPLFPYVSAVYLKLVGGNAPLFYFTSTIEACIASLCIYRILRKKELAPRIAFLGAAAYLLSGIVLYTTEHQTGVFFASACITGSYLALLHNRRVIAGIAAACAFAAKGYFAPVVAVILLYALVKDRKRSWPTLAAFGVTVLVILLPTMVLAFPEFRDQVFGYSATRPQGIPKLPVFLFFAQSSPVLGAAGLYAMCRVKAYPVPGMAILAGLIFLTIYPDVYFFYLNMLAPFAAIAVGYAVRDMMKLLRDDAAFVLPVTVVILATVFVLSNYLTRYRQVQLVHDYYRLVDAIRTENPPYLYGMADFTPALSYLTDVPLLDGRIDTNENMVVRKILDPTQMTEQAIEERAMLVTYGVVYPEFKLNAPIYTDVVDRKRAEGACKLVYSHPVLTEGIANRINLHQCGPQ